MENLKTVFLESYRSMYCRAKSIINKEEDAIALMKETYLLAVESNVADINAKDWMAKQTYIIGCGKFRKKKAREAEVIELQEHEYEMQKGINVDKTKELICETLTELPDLYQATLFAFYHDQYSVKEVAAVTGYSEGVVINRLNYIHKYLSKKLEDYQEENKVKLQFSVEIVYEALKEWATRNTVDETVVQNVYTSLCLELNLPVETLFDEEVVAEQEPQSEVESESVDNGFVAVKEELQVHSVKSGLDKKQVLLVAAIVGGLAVLALIAILLLGNGDKSDEPKDNKPPVEEQEKEPNDSEEGTQKDIPEDSQNDEPQEGNQDDAQTATDSSYILQNSNTKRLTRDDLQGLSKEELRLARNEIFARHGMIFGVEDLDDYFATKSWYKPTVAYDDFYNEVEMSMIEEANLVFISQVEDEME